MAPSSFSSEQLVAEFQHVDLGDARLNKRLRTIVASTAAAPSSSFPNAMKSVAEQEGLYRFLSNKGVTLDGIIAGHVRETHRRIQPARLVRIAHDTTSLQYRGDREGLGPIKNARLPGYFAHCALAISAEEVPAPLGVLAVHTFANSGTKKRYSMTRKEQVAYTRSLPRNQKQSARWESVAERVSRDLPAGVEAIHVMDQEADDFAMLGELVKKGLRFVVRGAGNRKTATEGVSVARELESQAGKVFRKVQVSARRKFKGGMQAERTAALSVRWSSIRLARAQFAQTDLLELDLSVVHVYEANPPSPEQRIEWFLMTTEPVENLKDATAIVDHYRARWLIEEYFKALKTGCSIEKRQLTSYEGLVRALGIYVPIAWSLLALRHIAAARPEASARELFEREDLVIVRALLRRRKHDHKLAEKPTVRDVMLAIAALGGHIKNNGDPGWIVLSRGYQYFVDAQALWDELRSDQS